MNAPWYRMHANLSDTKVVWRAAEALGVSGPTAAGHLAFFWGKVSQHAPGGDVTNVPDRLLEEWAMWRGKAGRFAAFIREQHSTDGKINDYDEFNGKLEERRARDRERKASKKSGDGSGGVPQDFQRNSGGTPVEAPQEPMGYDTKRDEREENLGTDSLTKHSLTPPTRSAPAGAGGARERRGVLDREAFERAWARYPRRAGGNPRRAAEAAWNARLRQGVSSADLVAGVERYRAYCDAEHQTGTRYVMQAARFFGPDERYAEAWEAGEPDDDRGAQLLAQQRALEARGAEWLRERQPELVS